MVQQEENNVQSTMSTQSYSTAPPSIPKSASSPSLTPLDNAQTNVQSADDKIEDMMKKRRQMRVVDILREWASPQYILQFWAFGAVVAGLAILYTTITFLLVVQFGPKANANPAGRPEVPITDNLAGFWFATFWASIMGPLSKFAVGFLVCWKTYGSKSLSFMKWIFIIPSILSFMGSFAELVSALNPAMHKYQNYFFYFSLAPLVVWLFGLGVRLGKFIKHPKMWVYWLVYAGAFIITSMLYTFVLPKAAQSSYYVLRLIIHPTIMGFMTITAKVMAYRIPHAAEYQEYIIMTIAMAMDSFFGRILLNQQSDRTQIITASIILGAEQIGFKLLNVLFARYLRGGLQALLNRQKNKVGMTHTSSFISISTTPSPTSSPPSSREVSSSDMPKTTIVIATTTPQTDSSYGDEHSTTISINNYTNTHSNSPINNDKRQSRRVHKITNAFGVKSARAQRVLCQIYICGGLMDFAAICLSPFYVWISRQVVVCNASLLPTTLVAGFVTQFGLHIIIELLGYFILVKFIGVNIAESWKLHLNKGYIFVIVLSSLMGLQAVNSFANTSSALFLPC